MIEISLEIYCLIKTRVSFYSGLLFSPGHMLIALFASFIIPNLAVTYLNVKAPVWEETAKCLAKQVTGVQIDNSMEDQEPWMVTTETVDVPGCGNFVFYRQVSSQS